MKYITSTFTPAMLRVYHADLVVDEIFDIDDLVDLTYGAESAVGHEVTAKILSALLGREVAFNRANLALKEGDEVIAIIPNFRASEAREFTEQEVRYAGFRAWRIQVR